MGSGTSAATVETKFTTAATTTIPTTTTTISTTTITTNAIDSNTTSTYHNMTPEDIQQYLQHLQDEEFKLYIPVTILLIIIAVTGLVGNVLVLLVYRSKRHKTSTTIFIMAIAVFDLVANVLCIPGRVYENFHLWNGTTPALCRLLRYSNLFTTTTSAIILLAVAVDKYRKICRPFGWQVSTTQAKIISVGIAIFAMTSSIPYCIIMGSRSRPTPRPGIFGYRCSIDETYIDTIVPFVYYGVILSIFTSLCILLIILYTLIGVKAYRHSRFHGIPAISKEASNTVTKVDDYANERNTRLQKQARREHGKCYFSEDNVLEESTGKKSGSRKENNIKSDAEMKCEDSGHMEMTSENTDDASLDLSTVGQIPLKPNEIEIERYASCCSSDGSCTDGKEVLSEQRPTDTTGRFQKRVSSTKHVVTPANKRSREGNETGTKKRVHDANRRQRRMMSKTTVKLFLITAVFILAFIPHSTIVLYNYDQPGHSRAMGTVALTLCHLFTRSWFLNSAVNPIIYSLCDVKFRRSALRVVTGWRPRRESWV